MGALERSLFSNFGLNVEESDDYFRFSAWNFVKSRAKKLTWLAGNPPISSIGNTYSNGGSSIDVLAFGGHFLHFGQVVIFCSC